MASSPKFLGAVLSGGELLARMKADPPLVENLVNLKMQLGPNGVDLTLNHVERFKSSGSVDFDNTCRIIPGGEVVEFNEDGWVHLKPGAYRIVYNEIVNVPRDLVAFGFPRSTLLRCGATVETAVWDSGYRGRSTSLLHVYNSYGLNLKRNARIVQLVFIKLSEPAAKPYSGVYQGENI